MSTQIEEIWGVYLNGSGRLACLGVALTLLGWLAVRCRVTLPARITAAAATLMLLGAGGLLVMTAPFFEVPRMPVVAKVLESVDTFGEDILWRPETSSDEARAKAAALGNPGWISGRGLACAVWLCGAVIALIWLARDGLLLRGHLRKLRLLSAEERAWLLQHGDSETAGTLGKAILLADASAAGPYSCGWLRQRVVIPASWLGRADSIQLAVALAHESAHLRHHDGWTLLAWRLVRAMWWWNPAAHALAARVDELLAWRADEEAVGGERVRAVRLSRTLLDIVARPVAPCLAQGMAASSASLLRRRLQRLLGAGATGRAAARCHAVALALLAIIAVTAVAGCALPGFGGGRPKPFADGEIIHTTPDEWSAAKARHPVLATARFDSEGQSKGAGSKAADKLVADMERKARRHGKASDQLIGIEIKFIESNMSAGTTADQVRSVSILSETELSSALRASLRDPATKTVTYPRMVTRAGHVVMIRSVVNQPVMAASASTRKSGGGGTTESSIEYVPVGTVLNFCPVIRSDERIHLESDVMLSRIIGEEKVGGNPYPVISARTHRAAYDFPAGSTMMISQPGEKGVRQDILITATLMNKQDDGLKATRP